MEITVTFRHVAASAPIRRHAEERIRRVAKYLHRPIDAHVILSVVKRRHAAEIVLHTDRTVLKAVEETGDLYSAIDLAADKLEQQARKHTDRIRDHKDRRGTARSRRAALAADAANAVPVPDVAAGALRMDVIRAASVTGKRGPQVIRTKRLPVRPMSVEEAVMQLDLMDNDFLVFRSAASGGVSVVYRRKDGHYGLIEPDVS